MSRRTIVSDQDGLPLISIGEPGAAIAGRYPRETPRAFGEPLFEYVWLPHGFRRRREGELCDVCDWPTCAPWHSAVPAPAIGPVRALVFAMFAACAGVILTLVYLRGGL